MTSKITLASPDFLNSTHHIPLDHQLKCGVMAEALANNILSSLQPVCQNCQTSTTPLWRRDELGSVLCNACGLFLKLHGRPRPISLKTDVIKSRNRVKSTANGQRKRVSQQKDAFLTCRLANVNQSSRSRAVFCQHLHQKEGFHCRECIYSEGRLRSFPLPLQIDPTLRYRGPTPQAQSMTQILLLHIYSTASLSTTTLFRRLLPSLRSS